MKSAVIMRGLSGSGKTHLACSLMAKANLDDGLTNPYEDFVTVKVSADDTMMEGVRYNFRPEVLPTAHKNCQRNFLHALQSEVNLIIVDNTNIEAWEIAPYYTLAELFGYDVVIKWVVCPIETCIQRNVHKVPEQVIRGMCNRFGSIPGHWKQEIVLNG
jgi:predicted kinase